jgi:hypothetical protein
MGGVCASCAVCPRAPAQAKTANPKARAVRIGHRFRPEAIVQVYIFHGSTGWNSAARIATSMGGADSKDGLLIGLGAMGGFWYAMMKRFGRPVIEPYAARVAVKRVKQKAHAEGKTFGRVRLLRGSRTGAHDRPAQSTQQHEEGDDAQWLRF